MLCSIAPNCFDYVSRVGRYAPNITCKGHKYIKLILSSDACTLYNVKLKLAAELSYYFCFVLLRWQGTLFS